MFVLHKCRRCKIEKPEELFSPSFRKEGVRQWECCKSCNSKTTSRSRARNDKTIGSPHNMAQMYRERQKSLKVGS